jgi:hypothetical protein
MPARSGISGLALVAIAAVIVGCNGPALRRIHADNMLKAERFEQDFKERFSERAKLSDIDAYLLTRLVKVKRSIGDSSGRSFVQLLMIEVENERSLTWGCGRSSVGIIAGFTTDGRLLNTRVSSWSDECL